MSHIKLAPDEEVVLRCRKHWFVYAIDVFVLFILFVLPYLGFKLTGLSESIDLEGRTYHLIVFLYTAWFLLLWTYFFVVWTRNYLDQWVLTNKRVISINQVSLFHREVTNSHYEKVQDVTTEVKGVVQTMLGFGDIHIQTAGEDHEIVIDDIPNPNKVKQVISDHLHKTLASQKMSSPDGI